MTQNKLWNHYNPDDIPGCQRYFVFYIDRCETPASIGQTNVMACSQQHALHLIALEAVVSQNDLICANLV